MIVLEKVYSDTGKHLGTITVTLETLEVIDNYYPDGLLYDIDRFDRLGYRKYKDILLEQKKYILRR